MRARGPRAAGLPLPVLTPRILHVTDRLSDRGGAHVHLQALVTAQSGRRDVHVAAGAIDATDALPPAVTVHAQGGLEARTREDVDLAGLVRRLSPDVVHVHTVVNPAALEQAAALGAVITVQDHRYFCPARGRWTRQGEVCRAVPERSLCAGCFEDEAYFREIWAITSDRLAALGRFRAVIVLSHAMRDDLVLAGVSPSRVHVVPPLVLPIAPRPPDGPPCVLFVGRLTEAKGVRDAVLAWKRSGVALPLVMAGTGPLRAFAESEGASVLGWVPRARLGAVYARARAMLLPPRWQEPYGIAGVEALRAGVPVVAWRSGGIPEWHPGGDELVDWGDVDALAASLRSVIEGGDRVAPPPSAEPPAAAPTAGDPSELADHPLATRVTQVYDAAG